jgi:hypothetical protein
MPSHEAERLLKLARRDLRHHHPDNSGFSKTGGTSQEREPHQH